MKTNNFLLLLIFIIGFGFSVQAKKVELKEAKKAAVNCYYEKVNQYEKPIRYEDIVIKDIFIKSQNGKTMFYAFDFKGGGFVIISAEDQVYPIIGYSYQGKFPVNELGNTNYGSFIQSYVDEIVYARNNNIEEDAFVRNTWNHLLLSNVEDLITEKGDRDVDPLLYNLWNQDDPYNIMCPLDEQGPGGHVYAGCVATAMSMIMHYWGYPETGEGSHSYSSPYGTLSVNFGDTEYDWTGMAHEAQNVYPWAIAEIQYHCGVAVEMNYSPNGSGSQSEKVAPALKDHFRYNNALFRDKQYYNNTNWIELLKSDLDMGRPMYYSGVSSDNAGHAFVCDGYQGNNFHYNFGWSGSGNGFYSIYNVGGFYRWQKIVKNFYPTDPDYPYYAEGDYTITSLAGSFTDGSGPLENYLDNQSATWLIEPQTVEDSVEDISLEFHKFDLDGDDEIVIYDGPDVSATVLATYSGNNPPTIGQSVTSSGNQVFVTFDTDGSGTGEGFLVEFKCSVPQFCSGMTMFTEPTATFEDGSGSYNYSNNANCMYKIEPDYAGNITLYFNDFETEEDFDNLKVYDGTSLLGTFSGNEIPDPVVAESGSMFITFNSNAWTNAPGWELYYTIDNVSVNENAEPESLSIYPNPVNEKVYITFKNHKESAFDIELVSMTGKSVYTSTISESNNWIKTSVDVSNLPSGIYVLKIQSSKHFATKRIVVG